MGRRDKYFPSGRIIFSLSSKFVINIGRDVFYVDISLELGLINVSISSASPLVIRGVRFDQR